MKIKYPEIEVKLTSVNGNALSILGAVTKALKNANISKEEVDAFKTEALAGNYDHLLQTCMKWVNVS